MSKELDALERLVYAITHDVNAYSQYTQSQPFIDKDKELVEQALKEHEQHKVIEQELGIDLITLFKALREPVYVKVNDKIVETYCGHIGEECKTIDFEIDGKDYKNLYDVETFYVLTKDYGKDWALTKEELK